MAAAGTMLLIAAAAHAQDGSVQNAAQAAGQFPGAAPCLVEAHRTVKLATSSPGVLARVLVDRGDMVKVGAVVAELTTEVEAAELEAAKIKVADRATIRSKEARRDFTAAKAARLRQLRGAVQFASVTALEEAEADAHQAEADLQLAIMALRLAVVDRDMAQAKLDHRRIVSSVSGVVTDRTLSAGEYGYEQQAVVTVAELDPLSVELFMPVAEYGRFKLGQALTIRPQAPIGGSYTGTIEVIDRVIDSRSGTFGLRLMLPNPGNVLPAGIRCTASPTG